MPAADRSSTSASIRLNACRYLTGEEPEHIAAFASTIDHDGRFNEVEENDSWTMKFPSGIVAACNTTYGAPMEGNYRVHGSKGWLQVDEAFSYDGLRLTADFSGTHLDEPNPAKDPSHFMAEAAHFSANILDGTEPRASGEEGLRDMRYITEIYRSARDHNLSPSEARAFPWSNKCGFPFESWCTIHRASAAADSMGGTGMMLTATWPLLAYPNPRTFRFRSWSAPAPAKSSNARSVTRMI